MSDVEWEPIMPFVTVTSKGGPHDDESYVCGWEMGVLSALLDSVKPSSLAQTIHTSNVAQADMLAMRHGYRFTHGDDEDGWTQIVLEAVTSAL